LTLKIRKRKERERERERERREKGERRDIPLNSSSDGNRA
jgi:hypothetical protein